MDEGIKATKARPLTLLVVLSLGFVMAVLDTTGVALGVPEIKKFLVVSISESVWIINAYTLTLGTFLLLAGNLATKFGAPENVDDGNATLCNCFTQLFAGGQYLSFDWVSVYSRIRCRVIYACLDGNSLPKLFGYG